MPYICCPEKLEYVAQLSTLFVLLKSVGGLSNRIAANTVLSRPYDELLFFKNLGSWGQYRDSEQGMRTVRRRTFAGCYKMEMFAESRFGRSLHNVLIPEWWPVYE